MSVYFGLFAGWLAGLMLFGPAAPAWAASPANRETMPLAASDRPPGDGSVNAPDCKIPHPSLLQRYRVRPPWRVAGVDYCVGYPMSKALKDPAMLSMAGVAVDDGH